MPKSRKRTHQDKSERRISVRSVRRREPDTRKLARAVLGLVMAQAEADAQRETNGEVLASPEPEDVEETNPHEQ